MGQAPWEGLHVYELIYLILTAALCVGIRMGKLRFREVKLICPTFPS